MDIAQILGLVTPALAVGAAVGWVLARRSAAPDSALLAEKAAAEARLAEIQARATSLQDEAMRLREQMQAAAAARAQAETRLAEQMARLEQLAQEAEAARIAREQAERAREQARVAAAEAAQKLAEQEKRIADFEQSKKELTEAAKAATLESSKQLVGQLVDAHKRETEEQRKQQQEATQKTADTFLQQVGDLARSVTELNLQVRGNQAMVETVHRALSHAGGAGQLAEEMLENLLKSLGLEPDRDFIMQYHAEGEGGRGALRPDAVVFLPGDAALVIDSKATRFLLDHAAAEDEAAAEAQLANIAKTMRLHVGDLAKKDYKSAVQQNFARLGRGGSLRRLMKVMALPTDAAIDKLRAADPQIAARARDEDIILAGPSALTALIVSAKLNIDLGRQAENHDRIVELSAKLAENLIVSLGHVAAVNKGIESAATALKNFSGSLNRNVLPQIRKLASQGITLSKGLPQPLKSIRVDVPSGDDIIEAEAEEVPRLPFNGNDKT